MADLSPEQSTQDALVQKYPSISKFENPCYVEWKDGREKRLMELIRSRPALVNNPTAILAAMDHFAAQEDFLISIGPEKAAKFVSVLAEERATVVLELGAYIGYSAILIADELRRQYQTRQALGEHAVRPHVWSLEFEPEFADYTAEVVELAGLGQYVTIVTGTASDSMRKLKEEGKVNGVDLLFLDHLEEIYTSDLKIAEDLGLLNEGACVVADNVVRPGAPDFRTYVRESGKYEVRAVPCLIVPGEMQDEMDLCKVVN